MDAQRWVRLIYFAVVVAIALSAGAVFGAPVVKDEDQASTHFPSHTSHSGAGYNSDYRFLSSNSAEVHWSLQASSAGNYKVAVSWPHDAALDASVTCEVRRVTGNVLVNSVTLNQTAAPAGDWSSGGRPFQYAGAEFSASASEQFYVILYGDAGAGGIRSDAVALGLSSEMGGPPPVLTDSVNSIGQVKLDWTATEEAGSFTNYAIWKDGAQFDTVPIGTLTWEETTSGDEYPETHDYKVAAYGAGGSAGAPNGAFSNEVEGGPTEAVAPVEFSPAHGAYADPQSVTLSTDTGGATIRYTVDGTNPSATVGTVYSGAISIDATTNVRAIAYKTGFPNSSISSAVFTITGVEGGTIGTLQPHWVPLTYEDQSGPHVYGNGWYHSRKKLKLGLDMYGEQSGDDIGFVSAVLVNGWAMPDLGQFEDSHGSGASRENFPGGSGVEPSFFDTCGFIALTIDVHFSIDGQETSFGDSLADAYRFRRFQIFVGRNGYIRVEDRGHVMAGGAFGGHGSPTRFPWEALDSLLDHPDGVPYAAEASYPYRTLEENWEHGEYAGLAAKIIQGLALLRSSCETRSDTWKDYIPRCADLHFDEGGGGGEFDPGEAPGDPDATDTDGDGTPDRSDPAPNDNTVEGPPNLLARFELWLENVPGLDGDPGELGQEVKTVEIPLPLGGLYGEPTMMTFRSAPEEGSPYYATFNVTRLGFRTFGVLLIVIKTFWKIWAVLRW